MKNNIENWKDIGKIFEWLGLKYDFETESVKEYPFNHNLEDIRFFNPYITIPRKGIEEVVLNKIADKKDEEYQDEIEEIVMLVNIPFISKKDDKAGNIVVNVSVGFEYGKEYKYGEITKNKAQVCYAIMYYAKKTNDFYIIDDMYFSDFMSYYVMNNQWGIGTKISIHGMEEKIDKNFKSVYDD